MMTSYDGAVVKVRGTLNNCGGVVTPWKTYLTAEENFDQYFGNGEGVTHEMAAAANSRSVIRTEGGRRPAGFITVSISVRSRTRPIVSVGLSRSTLTIPTGSPANGPQSGVSSTSRRQPLSPCRARPSSTRATTPASNTCINFVSDGVFASADRKANKKLIDSGTLYVAKFNDDGSGEWMPLVFGQNSLTVSNGFGNQAEVLLFARQAADLLGATQMDRPDDVDINPVTGNVYMALINNTRRTEEQVDAANPCAGNAFGHIIEIREAEGDHATERFDWEIFMLCGDPADENAGAFFAGFDPSRVSKIANPDNLAFDRRGNLLIATDGRPRRMSIHDGIFFVPTEGPTRGFNRQIFSGPVGYECASVVLNTHNNLMLVSIQHPGEGGMRQESVSAFPDGGAPNRPSVVAVTRTTAPFHIGV